MKLCFFSLTVILFLFGFVIRDQTYRVMENRSFKPGESLEYRVHYGFINAGEAIIKINPKLYKVNNRVCYKIDIFGRTTGTFDLMLRIRDNWGTYMDTTSLVPQKFYRLIEEGRYRKNEVITFKHFVDSAEVKVLNKETKQYKPGKCHKVPDNVQDMVSGYYFLRTVNYNKLKINDIISIPAFFEDTVYNLNVKYLGREMLDTKFGEFKTIKLSPVMPENDLFDGENSIRVWLSDDLNKIPLKIQADMFVGAVEIDIKKYEGLKN